ncbi:MULTISPECIES: hypothetical protein [unclassified Streptomyces]|uniref:hypothetical protein n=1 Tax=unclassified Streptomyces TaxID=2593676 RepID=UPI00068A5BDB|nr:MULTISPECIES: hypothetical protein [unclassified Streptomyces]
MFTQVVGPGIGVIHSRVGILMPGEEQPSRRRSSMRLFVVVWREDRWVVEALHNARLLSPESMAVLESLPH